jgi:AcrR family transcriptional regulator
VPRRANGIYSLKVRFCTALGSSRFDLVQILLDLATDHDHYLNMVKNDPTTGKGEQTRSHIFQSALELFREKGFDSATMQDIAAHARVVKSAAYYYFPSKEAIIQAYYETVQAEQERLCEKVFAQSADLKVRLATAMHTKFDLAKYDRNQMGLLVMFLYDSSEGQLRTRRLADGSLALTLKVLGLAKLSVLKPVRAKILALLREADLLSEG